jgi:hypothetical protein
MSRIRDFISNPQTSKMGFGVAFKDDLGIKVFGQVRAEITYPNGESNLVLAKDNVYTLDGGILASMLFSGEAGVSGLTMLAVGSGATGSSSSPDVADSRQRKLNSEIQRKPFSSVVYRAADGTEASVPTNVVDFTTVFSETEASSAGLTEMGLLANTDSDPSVTDPVNEAFPTRTLSLDLTTKDILVNYLTFPVIHKPAGAVLAITWRLTF